MGGSYSEPVPSNEDSGGFFCIVLRSYDKARLLHAPPDVQDAVTRIARDLWRDETVCGEDKHGSLQLRLPGSPFTLNAGKESSTIGKIFAIRVFEEMNQLGYEIVASSDLSRAYDQSTWFFRKSQPERRPRFPVLCVSPGGADKLAVVRGCDYVVTAVRDSVKESWPYGIQNEKSEDVSMEKVYEFKLRGNPWQGEGGESTACRKLILQIIGNLGKLKWRLLTSTNLKGATDALFFIYDENHCIGPEDLAILSLNRSDRLRLINFEYGIRDVVRSTILRFFQTKEPEERIYHGAIEFKLKGYPFSCCGSEAVASRQFICRLLEALRDKGWTIYTTVDLSRKVTDKSVFIFRQVESAKLKFACVALSDVDTVRFLNFPQQVARRLREIVDKSYMPKISDEHSEDASCYEITLHGYPWSQESSYNLHARSMLLVLLREAFHYGWEINSSADVSAKFVHTENGPDYPMDVHSWFLSFQGVPRGSSPMIPLSEPRSPENPAVEYQELKVADLELDPGGASYNPNLAK